MKSFDELFENAILFDTIKKPKNAFDKDNLKSYYNLVFNLWLQENRGWEYGNEQQYIKLLTKENWKEFLIYEAEKKEQANQKFENEKATWQPKKSARVAKMDIKFLLTSFDEEKAQKTPEYKSIKRQVDTHGYFLAKTETDTVKIYSSGLALIFVSDKLPARNLTTKKDTKINGLQYLETYIQGYKEGMTFFENKFGISLDTLYGSNAELYVRDIHENFFHRGVPGRNDGWQYVKNWSPIVMNHEQVKEFGFHSGIVSKVEELVKKHPRLFGQFDSRDDEKSSQHTNKISSNEIKNNFDHVKIAEVHSHFDINLVQNNYMTTPELNDYLKVAFELKVIPKTRFKIRNAPTKEIIMEVFYRYYRDVAGKPHGRQVQYAALLGEYFQGFNTKTVSTNFSKTVY